ncbi:Phosphocarrier protein, nitrogen regulation associated [Methylophaga frappieri]|uniref:Phosphocarrier protein, nitrogen regulation associated n=1 Tax=Methylophaga frappieri (strain ATCC BAA-2434 / DSM 25690 / JAM7) TaxID=754477 RepID=I1YIV4_METFJ|nr:HPr family phosphocarrier protein [Methylophaga frappieri]AFJ02847.1 Phosphocarrier protein, nitrogen regulation associated [Methylophaga frappieri]
MTEQTFTIINKLGLHARAAAKFVTKASEFSADIRVRRDNREVNGKSIMGVMMLAAAKGTQITVVAEGDDEEQALQDIGILINDYFGEGQ